MMGVIQTAFPLGKTDSHLGWNVRDANLSRKFKRHRDMSPSYLHLIHQSSPHKNHMGHARLQEDHHSIPRTMITHLNLELQAPAYFPEHHIKPLYLITL